VEELTIFRAGINLANTLTRRREAYHEASGNGTGTEEVPEENRHEGRSEGSGGSSGGGSGPGDENLESAPSIHDLEEGLHFSELPPVDRDDRAIFVERVLRAQTTESDFRLGRFLPLRSWAREALAVGAIADVSPSDDGEVSDGQPGSSTGGRPPRPSESVLEIRFSSVESGALKKTLRFRSDGRLEVRFHWDASAYPPDAVFTTELSLGGSAEIHATPDAEVWRFPISTFSKSEKGFDETVQGEGVLVRWPVAAGACALRLRRG